MKKHKIEDLRWMRVMFPDVIPKYLVEQVRDRAYSVEDFYKYQKINCLIDEKMNPFNHLYVLLDTENIVKGFLWFVIDPLTKNTIINTYSVDKAYWFNGGAVKLLTDHMKYLMETLKLEKAYWLSRYPKHSERYGFKRSKNILMEYTGVENEKTNPEKIEDKIYQNIEDKVCVPA